MNWLNSKWTAALGVPMLLISSGMLLSRGLLLQAGLSFLAAMLIVANVVRLHNANKHMRNLPR